MPAIFSPAAFNLILHPQILQEMRRAYLYAVAKADRFYAGIPLEITGEHRHRIGIIQEPSVRANVLHVPRKSFEHRDGPERTHDPADPKRISNGLPHPILLGNLKIRYRTRLISADLNRVYNKISTLSASRRASTPRYVRIEAFSALTFFVDGGKDDFRLL